MSDSSAHIAAWEAAGLIDTETADRLRAATAGEAEMATTSGVTAADGTPADGPIPAARPVSAASALFGPGISIGEMFAYVGAAFLLGAWIALTRRWSPGADGIGVTTGLGVLAAAAVFVGLAAWLRPRSERFQRAAGVALLVSTALVGVGVVALVPVPEGQRSDLPVIVGSLAALVAAVAFRAWLPSVLTHLSTLYTATLVASSVLSWLRDTLIPPPIAFDPATPAVDPLVLVIAQAAFWGALSIVFGLVALREAAFPSAAAGRRAALTRAWAGLTAVLGVAAAVIQSDYVSRNGLPPDFQRVLEPWIGDVAILVVCALLVERAFRRDASAFVYPAALGVIIAATDLNATYLADSIEIGLIVEGGILIAGGILADRLRRQIRTRPPTLDAGSVPA